MTHTATAPVVCSGCRDIRNNDPAALPIRGHADCLAALRAELQANRWFIIRISPNGHVEGSTVAGPDTLIEDGHKQFTPRVRDRRREARQGWRHELVNGIEWEKRAAPCQYGECAHMHPAAQDTNNGLAVDQHDPAHSAHCSGCNAPGCWPDVRPTAPKDQP